MPGHLSGVTWKCSQTAVTLLEQQLIKLNPHLMNECTDFTHFWKPLIVQKNNSEVFLTL